VFTFIVGVLGIIVIWGDSFILIVAAGYIVTVGLLRIPLQLEWVYLYSWVAGFTFTVGLLGIFL
jgi:hypothetical protein